MTQDVKYVNSAEELKKVSNLYALSDELVIIQKEFGKKIEAVSDRFDVKLQVFELLFKVQAKPKI